MFGLSRSESVVGSPGPFHDRRCKDCRGSGRIVGKRVCFGANPHNEYFDHAACYGTGWAPVQRDDVKPVREGFNFMMFECSGSQCGRTKLVNLRHAATLGFPVCHGEPMKPQPKKSG